MASTPKLEHDSLSTPTAFGTLFRLPPELRLKVYRELLLNGSVRILESSKAIHGEAIEVLLKEGVCRLEYEAFEIWPKASYCSTIMNLEIQISLVHTYSSSYTKSLKQWLFTFLNVFFTPYGILQPIEPIPRKSCKIRLYSCERMVYLGGIIDLISCMNGFEVLNLAFPNIDPAESKSRTDTASYDYLPYIDIPRESVHKHVQAVLDPTLGPVQIIRDGNGVHMEFHPRAHYLREPVSSRRNKHEVISRMFRSLLRCRESALVKLAEEIGQNPQFLEPRDTLQ